MKSNQNFGVATHMLVYLSLYPNEFISSSVLAESVNTSPVVARRILKELANKGIIFTKQGKFGSMLNIDACSITLYDIYKIFHKGNILSPTHNPDEICNIGTKIKDLIEYSLDEANNSFEESLKKQSIQNIKEKIERGNIE